MGIIWFIANRKIAKYHNSGITIHQPVATRWFHELPLDALPLLRAAAAAALPRCCSATGAVLEMWSEQWRAATGEDRGRLSDLSKATLDQR